MLTNHNCESIIPREEDIEKTPEVPKDVRDAFEKIVRKKFAEWKLAHPDVEAQSVTIKDPIKFMLVVMAADLNEECCDI
jgi:hypothetical protein